MLRVLNMIHYIDW